MIEQRPFRRASGPYTIDYRGWTQDHVVVVRLRLVSPSRDDAAAVARAFETWLSQSTSPFDDAPSLTEQGSPTSLQAGEPRERSCGGCRLTWFLYGDSIVVSVCSGGEDGIDSTYWCCQEIADAALAASARTQLSWQEWRGKEFAEVEALYFSAPARQTPTD